MNLNAGSFAFMPNAELSGAGRSPVSV